MGESLKSCIAKGMLHKKLHFKCSCIIPIDFIGEIEDFEISNNEIIFKINNNGKMISIGENHPNMQVEEL